MDLPSQGGEAGAGAGGCGAIIDVGGFVSGGILNAPWWAKGLMLKLLNCKINYITNDLIELTLHVEEVCEVADDEAEAARTGEDM